MENQFIVFREGLLFGIIDSEKKVVVDPIYADIAIVPNYFDLGFNTFQTIYRLRKSLNNDNYIYFAPSNLESENEGFCSKELKHRVAYFYRDYSLIEEDGSRITRLHLDGILESINYPDDMDNDNLLGLLRCDDLIRKAKWTLTSAGDILELENLITIDEATEKFGFQIDIASLPGNLGFEKIINEEDNYKFFSASNLSPTSAEFNLNLGVVNRELSNSLLTDYTSLRFNQLTDFDEFGFALVQDPYTNKWAFINRYFFIVSPWFDYYCNEGVLAAFYGVSLMEDERLVIDNLKLIKIKFNGDFITQILINPSNYFDNNIVYNKLMNNEKTRKLVSNSVYWKFDKEIARRRILHNEPGLNIISDDKYQLEYKSEDFMEHLNSYFGYFLAAHLYWKNKGFEGFFECIEEHHSEMGIIPNHAYVVEQYGYITDEDISYFRPFGYCRI